MMFYLDAYKRADGTKVDGRRLVVDYERGRTQKSWLPRRLEGNRLELDVIGIEIATVVGDTVVVLVKEIGVIVIEIEGSYINSQYNLGIRLSCFRNPQDFHWILRLPEDYPEPCNGYFMNYLIYIYIP
uniref:DUF569 domain-containing protein n=1 Tax=Heterorhabditis bacteriophora TaxID=37862 RepID=A0A1I7WUN0_HETBA